MPRSITPSPRCLGTSPTPEASNGDPRILVVFRTGQAYNRFWDGSTLTHQMRGDWFDAASSIISFTRTAGWQTPASSVHLGPPELTKRSSGSSDRSWCASLACYTP